MTEPTRLFLGLKKFLAEHVFNFSGNVNVVNLPETQKVEVVNHMTPPESMMVSNLGELSKELVDKLQQVSSDLSIAFNKLDKPDDYSDIIKALGKVSASISEKEIPQTELAPILTLLNDAVTAIKDSKVNVDLEPTERILGEILAAVPSLSSLIEKDRIKVILSDEQIKRMGASIALSPGGGGLSLSQLNATSVHTLTGLEIPAHDYIGLTYTGSNLTTVLFKTGGSGGTTVATLTLGYVGSVLSTVTKT